MKRYDYHGYRLEDALRDAELVIGEVRTEGKQQTTEFIVGRGDIRRELFSLLEQYSLNPQFKWENDGIISVIIE